MESFAVLGSDSEDEMTNKPEYIQALRDVQTFDGTISLSVADLPRFPPGHKPIPNPQQIQTATPSPKNTPTIQASESGNSRKLSHENQPNNQLSTNQPSQMPKSVSNNTTQPVVPTSTA
ncbi:Oidioi.mRNA.OKI2018_I69.PAR.g10935.t1.cds [Oikopleura dioica]|uniref:Oidioi.mRNA.OKI2018_I69.PAR.g10935.t1.cds n=1 Tax=Oikopleura dioica TaxID=34765 RepID=A0ABN7RYL1_OIKDI|nr:Oidioi.mRNA.OKI2018_I69.PAR.g10935.t1.cds [Oikopleura dioica]